MVRGPSKRYGDVLAADGAAVDVPAGKVTRYPGWAAAAAMLTGGWRPLRADADP